MHSPLAHVLIMIIAFIGVGICLYINHKKRRKEHMVCPMNADCDVVVNSTFSRFFGIPIELIGLAYYSLTILLYAGHIVLPGQPLEIITFPLALGAFLFSIYLTYLQAVVIRDWCSWCLTSAGLTTAIFVGAFYSTNYATLQTFLTEFRPGVIALHLIGLALGLGAATVSDIMFFRFIKDLRISQAESNVLNTISNIIWFGLGLLIVSGVGLFLTGPAFYLASTKFLAKMIIVAIIAVNGAFLNLYIAPKLIHISFGDMHEHMPGELRKERRIAYALGAISMVSWYSAFTLGILRSIPLATWWILAIYFGLVAVAIIGSQIVERHIAKRGWGNTPSPAANKQA